MSVCLGGCSPFQKTKPEAKLLESARYDLVTGLNVPAVQGVQGCGAQALATIVAHEDGSQASSAIAAELPWHDHGATPVDLLLEARRRGFSASIARGSFDELAQQVRAGRPAMVMMDAGLEVRGLFTRYPTPEVMHWAVCSGVSKDGSRVLLAAEEHRHHIASRKDFERRWSASDNCMIVITAPR